MMRMVIPPKASTAVFMTAAPSATEEALTAAFPPASYVQLQLTILYAIIVRTFSDLVDDLLSSILAHIVHDDISAAGSEEE